MTIFIFIAILFTIGVAFTVGLVMPKKTMVISSEVVIDLPKEAVWDYVRLLRNQEHYNTWILQDPNIKMKYSGTDGTPGFVAGWESKTRMGNGEQVITKVYEGEGYESELHFENHENITYTKVMLESVDQSKTKVSTVMSATPSFPMNVMMPVMQKVLKKNMDENSAKLKAILES